MLPAYTAPSDLVRTVYFEHVDHFGDPNHSIRFEDDTKCEVGAQFPPIIDVMIWRPDDSIDIATFSTIGMSERPMGDANFRAELHFAIRRESLTEEEEYQIAIFLANLATYPFYYKTHLDWWHSLRDPGRIPFFSEGMAVLFHPRFVVDGWDTVTCDKQEVRLLNVVPITQEELQLKKDSGLDPLFDRWTEMNIDLFTPR